MGLYTHSEMTIENCAGSEYPITEDCEFLSGRACVCTYWTSMKDKELMLAFAREGFAGVERILTQTYKEHYHGHS